MILPEAVAADLAPLAKTSLVRRPAIAELVYPSRRTVFPFHPTLSDSIALCAARHLECPYIRQGAFEDWAEMTATGIRAEVARVVYLARRQYRTYDLDPAHAWLAGTDLCPL